jgi:O-antigen/teichoic acid export membrane protein
MDVERRALVAVKWAAIGRVASQLLSWASTIVVMRLLQPADYGLMALVAVTTTIAASIGEAGINAGIVQARRLDAPLLRKLAGLTLVVYGLLFVAVLLAAPLAASFFGEPQLLTLMQVASLQFLLSGVGAVPQSLAVRDMRFKLLAGMELLSNVIGAVLTLALAWLGYGVWALLWGALAINLVRTVALLLVVKPVWPSFDLRGTADHIDFGSRLALATILWALITQSDSLIGGRLLSAAELGIYAVALHLATLPMQKLMGVINQVAFSAVARLQDERERLQARLLTAERLLATVAVPSLWGLGVVADAVIALLLGPKWAGSALPMLLLSIAMPLRMIAMLFITAISAVGRSDIALRNTLYSIIIWPACFLVGAQFGVVGLAAAWLVSVPLSLAVNFSRMCEALGVRLRQVWRAVWPALVAGLAMAATVAAARAAIAPVSAPVSLAVGVTTGVISYCALLWLLDKSVFKLILQVLKAARGEPAKTEMENRS